MTMNEAANLIEILKAIGWTSDQITNLMLGVEGRISIQQTAENHALLAKE